MLQKLVHVPLKLLQIILGKAYFANRFNKISIKTCLQVLILVASHIFKCNFSLGFFKTVTDSVVSVVQSYCPYEASGKLNYLRTHYASHYFVNSAVAALCKSLINSVITKEHLFDIFVLRFKHLCSYVMIKIMFCFSLHA